MGANTNPPQRVRTESGQYKFTGANSGTIVTRTITLSEPGVSLDRMRLSVIGPTLSHGGIFYLTASNSDPVGVLVNMYLSDVDEITLEISDGSHTGTSRNALPWTVERW